MHADHKRLAEVLGQAPPVLHRGLLALRMVRVARWMHGRRLLRPAARMTWALKMVLTGADLDIASEIGPGTVLQDPRGVIVYGNIGANCTLGVRSGLGGILVGVQSPTGDAKQSPMLGAGSVLGVDALVLGQVSIGPGARIGEGCSVMEDLPPGAAVVARPTEWRPMRIALRLRPKPDVSAVDGLAGCIRCDVARAVLENGGHPDQGALRFWGHLILPGVAGVALFRIGQALHAAGWRRGAALVAGTVRAAFGLSLHPASRIGPGLFVPHPVGVRFCGIAGPNLTLYPHSTVGPAVWPAPAAPLDEAACPVLGGSVRVGAQGRVTGPVRIGEDATVGVGSQVTRDLGDGLSAVSRRNWQRVAVMQPECAHQA